MGRPATGHTPLRQCRVCRQAAGKKELERWVFSGKELVLDRDQDLPGRGWYACRRSQCSRFITQTIMGQAKKTGRLPLT